MSLSIRGVTVSQGPFPASVPAPSGTVEGELLVVVTLHASLGAPSPAGTWQLLDASGSTSCFRHTWWRLADADDISTGISFSDTPSGVVVVAVSGAVPVVPSGWGMIASGNPAFAALPFRDHTDTGVSLPDTETSASLNFDGYAGAVGIYVAMFTNLDTGGSLSRGVNRYTTTDHRLIVNTETFAAYEPTTLTGTYDFSGGGQGQIWAGVIAPAMRSNNLWTTAAGIAIPTDGGTFVSDTVPNKDYNIEAGEPMLDEFGDAYRSAWWTYAPTNNGTATIDTALSPGLPDTVLLVCTGDAVAAATVVASNDDGGEGGTSQVTLAVTAGIVYHIKVGTFGNASVYDAFYVLRVVGPAAAALSPGDAPPPTVVTHRGPRSVWYLVAYHAAQPNGVISELHSAHNIRYTSNLTDPDEVSFSVYATSEDMAVLADPRGIDVVLMCDDERVMRCRVSNNSGQGAGEGSHEVSFTAKSYTDLLGTFVLLDTDAAVSAGYTLVDAESVGWQLILIAMGRDFAMLGITRGGGQTTGILRTRTDLRQGDKIGDIISKLGESNEVDDHSPGQFEWDIDPWLVYRVYPGGRGKHTPAYLIDSGGAARSFEYQNDLTSTVNVVVAEGQDLARAVVVSPDIATDPGGRCELYVSASWVPAGPGNATIEGYARWVLLQHGNVPQITVTLSGAHWQTPNDLWVGDFARLALADGLVVIERDDLRVVAMSGEVSDAGMSAATLTIGRKFPGVFQAIDAAIKTTVNETVNINSVFPAGTINEFIGWDGSWKPITISSGGIHVFIQHDDPGGSAGVGDFWLQT